MSYFPKNQTSQRTTASAVLTARTCPIPARIKKSQSASPLIRGREGKTNGTKQDKRAGHRANLL